MENSKEIAAELQKKIKRLESELRRKEKAYGNLKRSLDEALQRVDDAQQIDQIGYWEYSFSENKIFISSGLRTILRMQEKEPVPEPEDFFKALSLELDNQAEFDRRIARIIETGEIDRFVVVANLKGEKRVLSLVIRLVKNLDGSPMKLVGVDRDITDSENSLKEIARSEKRYRHLFETSSVGFILADYSKVKSLLDTYKKSGVEDLRSYILTNEAILAEIVSSAVIKNVNNEILRIYKTKDQDEFLNNLDRIFTPTSFSSFVNEMCSLYDGNMRHISENETKNFHGDIVYTMTITERDEADLNWENITLSLVDLSYIKRAEAKVAESEMRWNYALEGNKDGVWDWDFEKEEFYFSDQFKQIFGYSTDEFPATLDNWIQSIHEEDRDTVRALSQDHINGKTDFFSAEYRVICKDGSSKWVLSRGKIAEFRLEGSRRFIGTITDISKRKNYEEVLERSEKLLQAISNFQMSLIRGDNLNETISIALKSIGTTIAASRIQVYKRIESDEKSIGVELRHEWTDGKLDSRLESKIHSSIYFHEHGYNRWLTLFSENKSINSRVEDLPKVEARTLAEQGIFTVFATPILYKDNFWGFFEFDVTDSNKTLSNSEIHLLKNFAHSFAEIESSREAERLFKEQQGTQQVTLDSIADAVITIDTTGNVLLINPHARSLLKYDSNYSVNIAN